MGKNVYLKQSDNYKKNFGFAYRTSTIFYYKNTNNFSTIINFMNYWPIKTNLDVMVLASLRDLEGNLILRERIDMGNGMVFNYAPDLDIETFEGSIEMEAFAAGNLGIPFAAMGVIYDAEESVSMVHGYTRTYTPHEIEEGRTITFGEEAGLVSRDNSKIRSFIIGHNGISEMCAQNVRLWMTNSDNETREVSFEMPKMNPFQTFKILPRDHFEDLEGFLGNKIGNCAYSFELSGGFTRTLVGNETLDGKEMQVLHSNFNYSRHDPGYLGEQPGYFNYPITPLHDKQFVHLDPFCAQGKYKVYDQNTTYDFATHKRVDVPIKEELLTVERLDGNLPARINIVFSAFLKNATCVLPMESARGFYHDNRPPKYRMWAIAALGKKFRSKLIIHSITDIYGPVGDSVLAISLYRENTMDVVTKEFKPEELSQFQAGVYVDELFPEQSNINENNVGQLWMDASSYGGHQSFTTIEADNGSASIEHNY